jgi:heme-degrading monooxygenase HmoA
MCAVVLINLVEVPPDGDESFVAGWEKARDFLKWKDGFLSTALHRSLAPEASFRFVNVAEIESVDAWRHLIGDPAFPGRELPFPAHPGLYEVVYEEERAKHDGVVLINAFDVPHEEDDSTFTGAWRRAHDYLAPQPGYLGTRLHQCIGSADFRFVNIAWWESPDAFAEPLQSREFGAIAAGMPYDGHPALYEVIRR